jgi:2-dehydropantoate 2-reductase
MKIAVVGTGGVGGLFGGLLALAGQDVVFIARGAHLRAIRARGLKVERPSDGFTVAPANATDDPADVGPADLVLLCVKTYDLEATIAQIQPLVSAHTALLTLQNGVEAPERVAAAFGAPAVLPGLVYCEAAVKEPGVIVQGSPLQRIVVGETDGRRTPRAETIAQLFAGAGVESTLSENVLGALWTKFGFICAMGGCTALARKPLGALLADDEGRRLLEGVMHEVRAVGAARGVRFDADPVAAGMATAARFPFEAKSSLQRDLERGARLEIEALNGAAVRIGRALGVPTPANQAIYAALRLAQPQ